jgi:uncharacterized protein (TIGR00725 family)
MSLPANESALHMPALDAALARLAERQQGPSRLRQPVAIIGPREATAQQIDAAYRVGRALARAGVVIVCGGKIGVMEGAARGAHDAGGICIGLLPEEEAAHGNVYLTVAMPTGLGLTRNALVVRAALCAIAIGGGLGTLSEMALALQWKKPVFAAMGAPVVPGAQCHDGADAALQAAATWLCGYRQQGDHDLGG